MIDYKTITLEEIERNLRSLEFAKMELEKQHYWKKCDEKLGEIITEITKEKEKRIEENKDNIETIFVEIDKETWGETSFAEYDVAYYIRNKEELEVLISTKLYKAELFDRLLYWSDDVYNFKFTGEDWYLFKLNYTTDEIITEKIKKMSDLTAEHMKVVNILNSKV